MRNTRRSAAFLGGAVFWRAAGLVLLAGFLGWTWSGLSHAGRFHTQDSPITSYTADGEALLHGLGRVDSARLPLSEVLAAGLFDHLGVPLQDADRLFGLAAALLVFAVGCLLEPSHGGVGAIAVLLLSFSGPGGAFAMPYPESAFTPLVLIAAALLVWRARADDWTRTILLSLAIGTTLLFRSPLAFFPPALAAFEWVSGSAGSPRRVWKRWLCLCLVPYLFLLPWIAMNRVVHRRFIPFENGSADSIIATGALGLVEGVEGDWRLLVDDSVDLTRQGAMVRWAAGEAARHPVRSLAAFLKRLAFALGLHPALLLLGAAGAWLFRRSRPHQALALLWLYYLGIHCTMSVVERYFMPFWPLSALLAACLVSRALPRVKTAAEAAEYRVAAKAVFAGLAVALATAFYAESLTVRFASAALARPPQSPQALAEALRRSPRDPWLYFMKGRSELESSRIEAAVDDLGRAAELSPADRELRLDRAWGLALLGKPEDLLAWPRNPAPTAGYDADLEVKARVFQAFALLRQAKRGQARNQLEAARDISLSNGVHRPSLSPDPAQREKLQTRDYRIVRFLTAAYGPIRSRPAVERLAFAAVLSEVVPQSADVWLLRASLEAGQALTAASSQSLERAEALHPAPVQWRAISRIQEQDKQYALALSSLSRGQPRERQDDDSARRSAALEERLGRYGTAASALRELAGKSPADADLWAHIAELESKSGDTAAANEALGRAAALHPEDAQARRIALLYQDLRQTAPALRLLDGLVERNPADAALRADRGLCRYLAGSAQSAIDDLKEAISLEPGLLSAYLTLGAIYRDTRRSDQAISLYAAALRAPRRPETESVRLLIAQSRRDLLAGDTGNAR